ncbi:SprT family zinc-dependent metalloprotease [Maricaulis sp.]|uniref:M48 family metallopeptidase n=1 Tax=Maricaulis sp. TaxID=1486257 RepID=UPI00261A9DC5|nr:SprT family zinc-dependent metalloprotease [Maricaulis sp.]
MDRREVILEGRPVAYALKRSRRRTIGFVIDEDGLRITAPQYVAEAEVERALEAKAGWILAKLDKWAARPRAPELSFVSGEHLPWLGQMRELIVEERGVRTRTALQGGAIRISIDPELSGELRRSTIRNGLVRLYKREGEAVMAPKTQAYADLLGRRLRKVVIREQKSRWGSCASDGTIRLNWRLMGFPVEVIDYVCAHEAAHLVHPNHSRDFWNTVEAICPDWKVQRDYMRLNSNSHVYF